MFLVFFFVSLLSFVAFRSATAAIASSRLDSTLLYGNPRQASTFLVVSKKKKKKMQSKTKRKINEKKINEKLLLLPFPHMVFY